MSSISALSSGLVAIAAAKVGAAAVTAVDIDANAIAAIGLNATINGVNIAALAADIIEGPPPTADLLVVGDLFYDPTLALRVMAFLRRCHASGIEVLIGDPERAHLPQGELSRIATHTVADFGGGTGGAAPPRAFLRSSAMAERLRLCQEIRPQQHDRAGRSEWQFRRMRRADDEAIGCGEDLHHRGILLAERLGEQGA